MEWISKPLHWSITTAWGSKGRSTLYSIYILRFDALIPSPSRLSSEAGVILLIFHLLFWDIIYDGNIPGSFETPYQYAPLDISEDTFLFAREDRIRKRLEDIENGGAQDILKGNDRAQRPKKPCCAGVNWDVCRSVYLVEIIEVRPVENSRCLILWTVRGKQCLGGRSLSIICTLLLEEYGARSARIPDLVMWNMTEGVCKFVHVMGPKDVLHDSQKARFFTFPMFVTAHNHIHTHRSGMTSFCAVE